MHVYMEICLPGSRASCLRYGYIRLQLALIRLDQVWCKKNPKKSDLKMYYSLLVKIFLNFYILKNAF